jgi:hypothetical protein
VLWHRKCGRYIPIPSRRRPSDAGHIEFTADHKDARNYRSKGEIVREQLGAKAAAEITPQELDQWLSNHGTTAATTNRYRAFLSLCSGGNGQRKGVKQPRPSRPP